MSARCLSRQKHCFTVASQRMDAIREALLIWDDCAENLHRLSAALSEKERRVLAEAGKYVENLHPNTEAEERVDRDILYAPADRNVGDPLAGDAFATEYYDIVKQIRILLRPKIRME